MLNSRQLLAAVLLPVTFCVAAQPTTGFEDSNGADWTSHEEELAFLAAVDALSERIEIDVIGHSLEGRPLHLVRIGHPVPARLPAAGMPVELHICSQHGNEPAGREACLVQLRDIALNEDPDHLAQLAAQLTLFIPTANPDGRAANSRTNAGGSDLNRQHLQVDQPEVRAIGRVIRDYQPVINMDHHEYGPSTPILYDDDVLILWPRNLNVHEPLRDAAFAFAIDHVSPCTEAAGYSVDEYGLQAAGDLDLQQTAGDWDDGISRNAGGLRHSFGILVESATSPNPANVEEILGGTAATQRRRVASQVKLIDCTLDWMRQFGRNGYDITRESMAAKAAEGARQSAPTYFDGQDEDTTVAGALTGANQPQTFQDPPYCGFRLQPEQVTADVLAAFDIHGIESRTDADGRVFVSMAQAAEPVIGLLLDERAERHLVAAEGMDICLDEVRRGRVAASSTHGGALPMFWLVLLGLLFRRRRQA